MHTTPFLIDCIKNNSIHVQSPIDTDCLCYSVLDENLVRHNKLLTTYIRSRPLRLANGDITETMSQIVHVDMSVNGKHQAVCGYVVPSLAYPMILENLGLNKIILYTLQKKKNVLNSVLGGMA